MPHPKGEYPAVTEKKKISNKAINDTNRNKKSHKDSQVKPQNLPQSRAPFFLHHYTTNCRQSPLYHDHQCHQTANNIREGAKVDIRKSSGIASQDCNAIQQALIGK